jgi:acyl-CoA synthetase (AMP-forming)/AMP-acid ligase II
MTGTRLWGLVEQRAASSPDAEMLVDERGRRVSFGEFRDRAERVSAGFAARGIGAGSAVTWQLPTTVETLVLTAALSRLGAVQNPVIPGYGERNLEFVVRQTRAELLVAMSSWNGHDLGSAARAVASRVPGLGLLILDGGSADDLPQATDVPPPAGQEGDPVRWIFYTSGTTAEPKGAKHTDASVLASSAGMSRALACTSDDRVGLVFPVAHIGGCGTWLGACLMTGCTLILDSAFDAERTTELQRRERVTVAGSGTVFTQIYLEAQRRRPGERLFPDVRVLTAGAAPRPPSLHGEVKRELGGLGVLSGYGMTEAPILSMAATTDPDDVLATTEGRPCPGVEIRVVASDGTAVGPGEIGELRVKGPQVMRGYVDEALDAEAFGSGGYLRTGDLGTLDAAGYLTITGRLKDVIIRKGETISARAIELELLTHPGVGDAAVVGLPHPGQGELACAVVVPADGEKAPGLDGIVAHLRERGLPQVQWPERLEIVTDLPRNTTGKVLKEELRARLTRPPAETLNDVIGRGLGL